MGKEDNIFVLSDGRKLGYAEYGDPKGKPVFYFHGWPSSRLRGDNTNAIARKLKIRLISPDRPGYGLSTFKKSRTLLNWADDVSALADHLKIKKFAVVGVSGGGPYAAVCAYKIPERLTKVGIVVGLAPTWLSGMLSGMSWSGKIGWANFSRFPVLAYLGALYQLLHAKYFPMLFTFQFRAKPDHQVLQQADKHFLDSQDEAFRQGIRGAARDLILYTHDWGFDVGKIKAKVFLWYGGMDRNVTLTMGKYYASQIKDSKLIVYTHEGHLVSKTHTEEIFRTLIN